MFVSEIQSAVLTRPQAEGRQGICEYVCWRVLPFSLIVSFMEYNLIIKQSVFLFVCLSVCLFVFLSVCLFVFLSVCLSVCLSVFLSVFLSVCLSFCLSVCLSVFLSVCLSFYLSSFFARLILLYPSSCIQC